MGGTRTTKKQGTKSSMAQLVLLQTTKERLEEMVRKYSGEGISPDDLLGRMMDIYEERMACPRGNR